MLLIIRSQGGDFVCVEQGLPYEHRLIEPSNRGDEFLNVYRTITQDPEANGKVPTIIGLASHLTFKGCQDARSYICPG